VQKLPNKERQLNKKEFNLAFDTLKKKFPYVASVGNGNENCEYTDNVFKSSDCYRAAINNDADCGFGVNSSRNCECLDYADSSDCYYSTSFARCYNLWYCYYCVDTHDCFGCSNLHNKSYCIFNVQYSKAEYDNKLSELKKMPRDEVLKKRLEIIKKLPQLHSEHINTTNSDYCDYVYNLDNCYYCFDCARDQDSGYLTASYECKDSWDFSYTVRGEQSLECSHSGDIYNCYQVTDCSRCYDSYFLEDCIDCHNCFGCTKLSHKQYCMLNIQYTKEEYEQKVEELRKELGLYFAQPA
jgi:hypothetical protein